MVIEPPSERVRRALTDALTDEEDQIREADRALIDDIVARVTERRPSHRYISEITSPPHPPVVAKQRVSPVIDADVAQYDCDSKVEGTFRSQFIFLGFLPASNGSLFRLTCGKWLP